MVTAKRFQNASIGSAFLLTNWCGCCEDKKFHSVASGASFSTLGSWEAQEAWHEHCYFHDDFESRHLKCHPTVTAPTRRSLASQSGNLAQTKRALERGWSEGRFPWKTTTSIRYQRTWLGILTRCASGPVVLCRGSASCRRYGQNKLSISISCQSRFAYIT